MAPRVEQLIEEIKALPQEEQQLLRETLASGTSSQVSPEEVAAEEEVNRRLAEAGIITEFISHGLLASNTRLRRP